MVNLYELLFVLVISILIFAYVLWSTLYEMRHYEHIPIFVVDSLGHVREIKTMKRKKQVT